MSTPGGGFWPAHCIRKPVPELLPPAEEEPRVTRTTVTQELRAVVWTPPPPAGGERPLSSVEQLASLGQICGESTQGGGVQ